ncbi:MAG TPA: potassium transporter, partial [Lachnoclostridium sp.]|nr:potassium transporter [Lachnoclostridium sp.]
RIIGMLFTGIILGPHVLGLLDDKILSISSELRQIALIIILLKAGLSLNLADLKKVGRPAVMMAFVPASFEICGYLLCAPMILGITRIESAVMGAVLAAVSPAVVVPRMVQLMENRYGTEKSIPQMILAGASCDDIFVIVLFSTFAGMAQGGTADFTQFLNIPVSIVLGILLGAAVGYLLSLFFETAYAKEHYVRNSMKVIVVLGLSFLLMAVETWAKPYVSVSGLLAVVSMACVLKMKCPKSVSGRLSEKFGKLWIAAEVVLFVMVGAAVDIRYTATAGGAAVVMILLALIFRAAGVCVCMAGTALNKKERLFTVIAYLPKATVQAAIGSVPMAMGLSCGQIVLSVAVLAILITAPLGAIGMDVTYRRLLKRQE